MMTLWETTQRNLCFAVGPGGKTVPEHPEKLQNSKAIRCNRHNSINRNMVCRQKKRHMENHAASFVGPDFDVSFALPDSIIETRWQVQSPWMRRRC